MSIKSFQLKHGKKYKFVNVVGLLSKLTIKIHWSHAYYSDGSKSPIADLANFEFEEVNQNVK